MNSVMTMNTLAQIESTGARGIRPLLHGTSQCGNDSPHENMSVERFPSEIVVKRTTSAVKSKTGVYFLNREVPMPIHPLQATEHGLPSKSLCKMVRIVPMGKPLSPAPRLGHLRMMRHSRESRSGPPHKVSRKVKHRQAKANVAPIPLSPEEELFLEAATALRASHVPSAENMYTHTKKDNVSKKALPPPPFRIAEAA